MSIELLGKQKLLAYIKYGLVTVLVMMMANGCAVKQALNNDPRDSWESYNRSIFAFNEATDSMVLKPIAKAYTLVLPEFARRSVSNMFSNLEELPNALNNSLQGDFSGSKNDILRFLINSTVGVLGLFDPATSMGIAKQEEDFAQTLAVWGVGSGPYFMLPLIGPSTVRGVPGKVVDFFISPLNWPSDNGTRIALKSAEIVSIRAGFLSQEKVLRGLSPDFYQQLKGFYLNRREYLIKDGAIEIDQDLYNDL